MSALRRDDFRYTRYFCEENIWWLAHSLRERGFAMDHALVWLITNPAKSVVLLSQRAAPPHKPMVWDYHVILQLDSDAGPTVLDFDTRLDFASPQAAYLRATFPSQSMLRERYRAWVRTIPASSYLEHFFSDRSHMRGRVPARAFPDYPPIHPPAGIEAISLERYRDLQADPGDGSRVQALAGLCPELA